MTSRRSLLFAGLALCGSAACARDPDTLELFFNDELVEAPARSVNVLALQGVSCDAVLSVPHDQSAAQGTVLMQSTTRYPIDPKNELLTSLPRGTPFALVAAVFDGDQVLIARACEVVTLDSGEQTKVSIEVHALPRCTETMATVLDLVLVLDTSAAMAVADSEKTHIAELKTRVIEGGNFPAGSTWSIVAFGKQAPPAEVLAPTTDLELLKSSLDTITMEQSGMPSLFDAVYKATVNMRARAVCGRRPAMLILSAGPDEGSMAYFEDASIGLIGTRGDATDDLFTFALAMTTRAYDVLADLVPVEIGIATGAETEFLRKAKLSEAATSLRGLVP